VNQEFHHFDIAEALTAIQEATLWEHPGGFSGVYRKLISPQMKTRVALDRFHEMIMEPGKLDM
jgi:hypothetical protein